MLALGLVGFATACEMPEQLQNAVDKIGGLVGIVPETSNDSDGETPDNAIDNENTNNETDDGSNDGGTSGDGTVEEENPSGGGTVTPQNPNGNQTLEDDNKNWTKNY